MFAEYRLREDAHQKALINAMSTSGAFILSAFTIWGYVFVFERELLLDRGHFIYFIVGILILASLISGMRTYKKLINFRMISTDEGLEMTTIANTVKVRYSEIERIERTKDNTLMVFTQNSARLPVVAISDTITNREYLEEILNRFVTIQEGKLPLQFNRYYRIAFSYLLMTVLMVHFVASDGNTIIATGLLTLGVFAWSTAITYRFRNQIPIWKSLIILILAGLIICFRIFLAVQPHWQS